MKQLCSHLAGNSVISSRETHLLLWQGFIFENLFKKLRELEQLIVKFANEFDDILLIYSIKYLASKEHVPLFSKLSHSSEHNL